MLNPQHPSITLRDVARALGISHSTVSRALKNSALIPEDHRNRIQAVAGRMGYRPNPAAAALARQRYTSGGKSADTVIAWLNLWPDAKELRRYKEFDRYWLGAATSAKKFGYRLEEFHCPDPKSLRRLARILPARGIRAVLLPPGCRRSPDLSGFDWGTLFVVRLGRSLPAPAAHVVTTHYVANSTTAFQEIYARGYRRVGWVEWEKPWEQSRMFKAGFLLAQSRVADGYRVPPLSLRAEYPEAKRILKRWLKKEAPDALMTDMAEISDLLEACGYRVPEDVGLAVNTVLDGNADAGINQNSTEIGRIAVLVLLSLVNDNDQGIPPIHREILINGTWANGSTLPSRETSASCRPGLSLASRPGAA